MPVDATSTRQRIADLLACGKTFEEIAEAAGRPPGVIQVIATLEWVSEATRKAVCDADRQLMGDMPGYGDVDEVVVERLMGGLPMADPPRVPERHEAIRRLSEAGLNSRQIAERIGCYKRSVERVLASIRQAAA